MLTRLHAYILKNGVTILAILLFACRKIQITCFTSKFKCWSQRFHGGWMLLVSISFFTVLGCYISCQSYLSLLWFWLQINLVTNSCGNTFLSGGIRVWKWWSWRYFLCPWVWNPWARCCSGTVEPGVAWIYIIFGYYIHQLVRDSKDW